jgi:hypothetical protein
MKKIYRRDAENTEQSFLRKDYREKAGSRFLESRSFHCFLIRSSLRSLRLCGGFDFGFLRGD